MVLAIFPKQNFRIRRTFVYSRAATKYRPSKYAAIAIIENGLGGNDLVAHIFGPNNITIPYFLIIFLSDFRCVISAVAVAAIVAAAVDRAHYIIIASQIHLLRIRLN